MKRVLCLLIAITVMAMVAAVNADVTIKRQVAFEMSGMPASEMASTEKIQGEKSLSQTEFTSGAMMEMTGGEQSTQVNITRLDRGVLWNVNNSSKTYNEIDLKNFKGMMEQSSMGRPSENKATDYEWTYESKTEDITTENGFKCKAVMCVATGVNKNDPADKVELRYEYWMADDIPGQDELSSYNQKYIEVIGMDPLDQTQQITKVAGEFGLHFEKMAENFKDLKGYPIKTVMTSRKSGAPRIPGMPEGEEMDPAAMAMMQKMMGGKAPKPSEDGMHTLFSVKTEVVQIETKAVENADFDIPEGYTKQ